MGMETTAESLPLAVPEGPQESAAGGTWRKDLQAMRTPPEVWAADLWDRWPAARIPHQPCACNHAKVRGSWGGDRCTPTNIITRGPRDSPPTESSAATKAIAFGPQQEKLANSMRSSHALPPRGLLLRGGRSPSNVGRTSSANPTER